MSTPMQKSSAVLFGITRVQLATAIAVLFHVIGFTGIVFFQADWIIASTPLNLLLMFGLILYTQQDLTKGFVIFLICCFITGIVVEIIGTKTGWLFGNYAYGTVLGPAVYDVPLIIGVNWFIVIYCCGVTMHMLLKKLVQRVASPQQPERPFLKTISVMVDGATLAVLFDWLMEPVAITLGYWTWGGDGSIPLYNYLCWLVISMLLLLVFNKAGFHKGNKFAVHLLLIQAMFFLLLRTFL